MSFIFKERSFIPKNVFDGNNNELLVRPNFNKLIITEKDRFIDIKTESINDQILLNLQQNGITYFPKEIGKTNDQYHRYQFSLPNGYGIYKLLGWINDSEDALINIKIMYINEIHRATQNEINI